MNNADKIAAIDKYIEILTHARERPEMWFQPIGAIAVEHFLFGLRFGIREWGGVFWSTQDRKAALDSRGLEEKAAFETHDLEQRGLSPTEIVDELLAIEIENWQAHRDALAQSP
jgi:hypothetical protein